MLNESSTEIAFFDKHSRGSIGGSSGLVSALRRYVSEPFVRIRYTAAVELLTSHYFDGGSDGGSEDDGAQACAARRVKARAAYTQPPGMPTLYTFL